MEGKWYYSVITPGPQSQVLKSPYLLINHLGTEGRKGNTEMRKQIALTIKQVIKMLYKATTCNCNVAVNDIILWVMRAALLLDPWQLLFFLLHRVLICFNMMWLVRISEKKYYHSGTILMQLWETRLNWKKLVCC